eukprot:jgi/Ulvmu1/4644/UM002_0375.1
MVARTRRGVQPHMLEGLDEGIDTSSSATGVFTCGYQMSFHDLFSHTHTEYGAMSGRVRLLMLGGRPGPVASMHTSRQSRGFPNVCQMAHAWYAQINRDL